MKWLCRLLGHSYIPVRWDSHGMHGTFYVSRIWCQRCNFNNAAMLERNNWKKLSDDKGYW